MDGYAKVSVASAEEAGELCLAEVVRQGALCHAEKTAVVDDTSRITYEQLLRGSLALADELAEAGVSAGDMVLICEYNSCEFVASFVAAELQSASAALVAPTVSEDEFLRRLELVSPKACIVANEVFAAIAAAHGVFVLDAESLRDVLKSSAERPAAMLDAAAIAPVQTSSNVIIFTSGSTGLPKAVVCAISAFMRNAWLMNESYAAISDDVLFDPLPFSHVFGLVGVFAPLLAGSTLATLRIYKPKTAVDIVLGEHVTLQYGVTTMLSRQFAAAEGRDCSDSRMRACIVGGDICPEAVMQRFEQRFGGVVLQSWGMSEASSTVATMNLGEPFEVRKRSVGKAVSGIELRCDPETGEFLCRSATLAKGYITGDGFKPLPTDEDGWFGTGDVGVIDDQGFVTISGRIKDIIVRGGMNIYPAEVERVYRQRDDVSNCCLVGFPDEELGERTCLCICLKDASHIDGQALRDYAKGKIEKCRIPDVVLVMPALPLLGNGKIDKKALKADACKQVEALIANGLTFSRRPTC